MRILVVGAGKLGFEIARLLTREDHDVVVIDRDDDALRAVEENLDVLAVHGNGAIPKVLAEAGAEKAGLLVAVAGADEVNIIASLAAKRMGVPVCAARVRNSEYFHGPQFEHVYSRYGIDVVINPERAAAVEVARIVKTPHATHVDYFVGGRVSVVGLKVDEGAPVAGVPLAVLRPRRCVIAAVVRNDNIFIPHGETVVQPDDRIYVVTQTGNFGVIRSLSGAGSRPLRRTAVVGGGRIGLPLVQLLARGSRKRTDIRLIERDRKRCAELASQLTNDILVIHGDGTKPDVLEEALIAGSDAFMAVTSDDATNLLAVMAAKQIGVKEAVTVLSREDYGPLALRAGADAAIVPRLIAVGGLLQHVRKHPVVSVSLLEDGRAEAVEVVVARGAPAVGKQLRQLALRGTVIGAILRHDDVIVPDGSARIEAGDHLVLFGMTESLHRTHALFRA